MSKLERRTKAFFGDVQIVKNGILQRIGIVYSASVRKQVEKE